VQPLAGLCVVPLGLASLVVGALRADARYMAEAQDHSVELNGTPEAPETVTPRQGLVGEVPPFGSAEVSGEIAVTLHNEVGLQGVQPKPVAEFRVQPPDVSSADTPDAGKPSEAPVTKPGEKDDPQAATKDFQATEADTDLREARQEINASIEALNKLSGPNTTKASGVKVEAETLRRLLEEISKSLSERQPVSAGLAVSVTVRVELVQEAAGRAADHADTELTETLKEVMAKTRTAGKKLLSMNLHLFPVKEWQLAGEVSALFAKGSITVTFGSGT
jgi:hypothetical protein